MILEMDTVRYWKELVDSSKESRPASRAMVYDLIETIESLSAKLDDLTLHSLEIENGEIDMKVSGTHAKIFMNSIVQFFKQNGGKNFVTTTMSNGIEEYAVTVQKCRAEDSPALKMERQQKEIEKYRKALLNLADYVLTGEYRKEALKILGID